MKDITKNWVGFAKEDLKIAEVLFEKRYYKGCSWNCHQAIEKILKAIIIQKRERPRKIHDLVELSKNAKIKLPENLQFFLEELNLYYLPPRYPDIYEQMKKAYRPKNIKRVLNLTRTLFLWLENYLK